MSKPFILGTIVYWLIVVFVVYGGWAFGCFDAEIDFDRLLKLSPLIAVFMGLQWWAIVLNFNTTGD